MKKLLFKSNFFIVAMMLFAGVGFAQTTGDYRSAQTGNWTTLSSWQYYNGTTWVTATNYPGQIAGTGAVTIRDGNTITITTSPPNSFISLVIGEGSSGTLVVGADINLLNVPSIIINPNAIMTFAKNMEIRFPANASLIINSPGKLDTDTNCTNNNSIYIGMVKFAVCAGQGNAQFTFAELNVSGGSISAVPSSNSPVCQNSTISLMGSYSGVVGKTTSAGSINGVIYSWTKVSGPTGAFSTSTSQNASIANASAGTYEIMLTCSTYYGTDLFTNSKTIFVIVNPLPTTPSISALTQPTCNLATGSVVLSGLPASGTWALIRSGTSNGTTSGTGTSTTISGLASGTYTFRVSIGTCTSGESSDVIINTSTNTWNGTSWLNGTQISTQTITFDGDFSSTTDLKACSCTVNSGTVKINSGHNLILEDKLTVNAPGTLTFEDAASLVQINDVDNSGNIIYNRNYKGGEMDYTYWSSPVAGQNLQALSPATPSDKFFSYNGVDWVPENPATTTMDIAKGYIIRGIPPPQGPPPGFDTSTFIGVPNNGPQSITVSGGATSNLIGNPYPSAIDADIFLSANSINIDGTLYFWTHYTPIQDASDITGMDEFGNPKAGSGAYAYTSDDYATYNSTGGTAAGGGIVPTGKIAAGQSFFTTSTVTGGAVNFTNAMRLVGTTTLDEKGTNQQFFKTKNTKTKSASIEKNRVWLNLTNTQGAFKQTLIGYITNATNEYDNLFDGESFDGNEYVDFYSVHQDKNLTIQGRALPFDENDEVPLGFRSSIEGSFTINIDQADGLLANQAIFIEDKFTNTVFDLKRGNYTFSTAAGTFDDRFVLRYTNKTLGNEELELNDGIIALYSNNYKTLIIRNNLMDATVNNVELFNLVGQNIANWDVKGNEQTNIQIPIKNMSSAIYIVKIKTTKGEFSKKIIIK